MLGKRNFELKSVKPLVYALFLIQFISLSFRPACLATETEKDSLLICQKRSAPANAGEQVNYTFELKNPFSTVETFHIGIERPRELACHYSLSDTMVSIEAGKSYFGKLSVLISDQIPVGGYESSQLLVKDKTKAEIGTLEFLSVRAMPHPYLHVTEELLEEVKEKIASYEWTRKNFEELEERVKNYRVPDKNAMPRASSRTLGYHFSDPENAFLCALVWKLTGKKEYLDKAVKLVRDVCDPVDGYPSIGDAERGVVVHEGFFFFNYSAASDLLRGAAVLTDSDIENIESSLRLYLEQNKKHMHAQGIMNHQASANAGAIMAALYLQDMCEVKRLIEDDGGMADQIGKGFMADGWWIESAPGYCYLVTRRYTLLAQAFENYGWDLFHRRFPAKYKGKDFDDRTAGFTGMTWDVWGPRGKNTRGLYEAYKAYIPMMDENACLVATNDAVLTRPNPFYELAYRHFREDEIAWVINKSSRNSWESLLYGVGDIPDVEDPRTKSSFVSNVGLVALRSQKKERETSEQIQAYLKFGTHGGWHGHFDRTGMVALDRYGHNYFGTEMTWFGYGSTGYKECVQTSATHNMVIVDELQQEAVPSEQLLFHSGDLMQASVVQTKARWRKIPESTLENYPRSERRLHPRWIDNDYEPDTVLQRRLTIVTDDYVLLADYLKGTKKHNYDWLIHPIGFKSIIGAVKTGNKLDKLNSAKDSPYKYFANAQWYRMNSGSQVHFEDEDMNLDVHTLWPRKTDVFIANYPDGDGKKGRGIRNNPERRTYGIRNKNSETVFINVIEPYKDSPAITSTQYDNQGKITVMLADGRKQTIEIENLKGSGKDIRISINESMNGVNTRNEKNNNAITIKK